jgi:hypothetical protein
MACTGCGGASKLQPAKSNGGEYILVYIGTEPVVTEFGVGTGTMYKFGTNKKEFFVNYLDVPGLFSSQSGHDLRAKI